MLGFDRITFDPRIMAGQACILTAKQQGEIPKARPVLEQLRLCGMYLSDRVMNQALARIGE